MPVAFDELMPRVAALVATLPATAGDPAAARLDPAYQQVTAEVAKLDAPSGAPVDWKVVVQAAGGLLRDRTKDLVLAAYLAQGLHATEGLEGLVTGTTLLAAMIDGQWETMQPDARRLRGRANALQWFLDRAVPAMEVAPEGGGDARRVEALKAAAVRLAEVARGRLGGATPAFERFLRAVDRLAPAAPPEETAAIPAPAPLSQGPASPTTTGAARLDLAGDPRQALDRLAGMLVDLAARLREATPADPAGYRLLRAGLWLHLDEPPAATAGRTSIPPPPPSLVQKLALLGENGQWAVLLDEVESALPRNRFSLDLQRWSWLALQGLGETHERARMAVVAELGSLLARMPGLPDLSFADGSPFAGPATRTWLDDAVRARPVAATRQEASSEPAPEGFADAARGLAEGRVAESLQRFHELVRQLGSGRARFLARLDIARACAAAGLHPLALASYRGLDADVRLHGLEEWEPALAVDTLKGLIAALRAVGKDARGVSSELDDGQRRLFRLDPAAAHEVWS